MIPADRQKTVRGLRPLRVCHVIASINEATGGPAYSVTQLAGALARQGVPSYIFTLDYDNAGPQMTVRNVKVYSHHAGRIAKNFRGFHPGAASHLKRIIAEGFDIVHNHGLWMFPNIYARCAAVANQVPYIISPRGMLEPWALKRNRLKKTLAWHFYEKRNFNHASAFHATSSLEALSVREMGFNQPIATIPNGMYPATYGKRPTRDVMIGQFPELNRKKWLLFMSRIHPKKGLETLVKIWKNLSGRFPKWQLIIAGSDLIAYQSRLKKMVDQAGLTERVTFAGMLAGPAKDCALSNAELFILPSHSENFGVVIAEALAHGIPVITTDGTPWRDLLEEKCGWYVKDDEGAIASALEEAMQRSAEELHEMGQRGVRLILRKYSWDSAANQMKDFYHYVLHMAKAPCFVSFPSKD